MRSGALFHRPDEPPDAVINERDFAEVIGEHLARLPAIERVSVAQIRLGHVRRQREFPGSNIVAAKSFHRAQGESASLRRPTGRRPPILRTAATCLPIRQSSSVQLILV